MDILDRANEYLNRKDDEKKMQELWNLLGRVGVESDVKVDVDSVVMELVPLIKKYPDYMPRPPKINS